MAAGIVASTLRRKAFHRRGAGTDTRYQAIEPGHIAVSPTDDGHSDGSPGAKQRAFDDASPRLPKGGQLGHRDFWPMCQNPSELNMHLLRFDTFDTLIPKANMWLLDNAGLQLVKCETIEKKVTCVDDVPIDNVLFAPRNNYAVYIKGLRLWYVSPTVGRKGAVSTQTSNNNSVPIEIGYMNVIPKCLDCTGKYPSYENLPETYAAINAYLAENPLEGKIVTIETVPLKFPRRQWKCPEVNPDQTCFFDDYARHVLYITRIYFRYGQPEPELIGAQDFLPDFQQSNHWQPVYNMYPRYSPLFTAMKKAKEWMHSARHIAVTNVQTLQAAYRRRPGNVHTGLNFVEKSESCPMVRYVRITYVRRGADDSMPSSDAAAPPGPGLPASSNGIASGTATVHSTSQTTNSTSTGNGPATAVYRPPAGFSYKTFVPSPVKVAMCSGSPDYEPFSSTWDRARVWLKLVDRGVIGVETFYHPLNRIWHDQDGGETTVMQGEWTATDRSERYHKQRRPLVCIVRVYLDGDYQEPSAHQLPPPPMVEEINDCRCLVM